MCVIINLPAGINVPYKLLEMAAWNNPHGYGLVIVKENGKLEVKKEYYENGSDPLEIDALLRAYDKYQRYLHLRWKTEGELSLDNVHPFEVFKKGNKEVFFMHNGTLHDYKPKDQDKRSDTKIFADKIISPFLKETGGFYSSEIGHEVLKKFWSYGSRGILISNFQPIFVFNQADWKLIKSDGVEFYASNDDYFTTLKRGFVFDKLEAEKKRREAEATRDAKNFFSQPSGSPDSWPFAKLKDIDFSINKAITPEIERFFEDSDLWSDEGLATLENLTELEIDAMVKQHPEIATGILIQLTSSFAQNVADVAILTAKNERASKMIEELKKNAGKVG